jgi:hypothetical protein
MVRANEYRSPFKSFKPFNRYAPFKTFRISELNGFADLGDFQRAHRQWVEQEIENGLASRDGRWSEAIAVGSLAFVETVKNDLGVKATHREVIEAGETYELRESAEAYAGKFTGKNDALSPENNIRWDEIVDDARRDSLARPGEEYPPDITFSKKYSSF